MVLEKLGKLLSPACSNFNFCLQVFLQDYSSGACPAITGVFSKKMECRQVFHNDILRCPSCEDSKVWRRAYFTLLVRM